MEESSNCEQIALSNNVHNELKHEGTKEFKNTVRDEISQKSSEIKKEEANSKSNSFEDTHVSSETKSSQEADTKNLEEQATLKILLDEATAQCLELKENISKRDETLANLERTKSLLEREKQVLRYEVELVTKEKESAVIRYATVEKSALDAKSARDLAEKKANNSIRDAEQAITRMKIAITEKNRVCSLFDAKCQEFRLSQREIERLKADFSITESKLKAALAKNKTETDARQIAEKKIEELNDQITQLKLNETSRAKEEVETEKALVTEKQYMEQSASLILLKHGNEEKERRIEVLSKKLSTATVDLNELNTKFRLVSADNNMLKRTYDCQKKEIDELQLQLDKEIMKVAELQAKVNEIESLKAQLAL